MLERQLDIAAKDGPMTTFICHPERDGAHPLILFFMDAPGIREELRDMARRIATAGYYVMLPNLYHRAGVMELQGVSRERMFELMNALTINLVMEDAAALIAFAEADPAARRPYGAIGYCMSGQYAVSAAARWPDRFAAAASLYGVRLVTEAADSPHRVAGKAKGELYFACAEHDTWAPLPMVAELKQTLEREKVRAEVEIYPGAEHGFAFPQRAAYDKASAERHWERLFALFRRNLP
ncbi:MAG TPA: dienelactone hydrolase family protein [Caulobacteraceae bacterium]|nr:dienelactone hydrolase family protein [Caulobacteraceae bacterium]